QQPQATCTARQRRDHHPDGCEPVELCNRCGPFFPVSAYCRRASSLFRPCVCRARMILLFLVQCRPTRGRKDALTAGERRILHLSSVLPFLPLARLMAAGRNAATWVCLGSCVFFTASGLHCGGAFWLQERC
ncbi:hypothetical protein TcCL_NonESM11536, partial [Trypanosoma cruzi]